jgi:hypothetical protein
MTFERVAGVAAVVLVAGGLAAGFAVIGSPGHARERELDRRRVEDVGEISQAVHDRYGGHGKEPLPPALPRNLRALRRDGTDATLDPATGRAYEYARLGETAYRLCIRFAQPLDKADAGYDYGWPHRAGRVCYRLDTEHTQREWNGLPPASERS